MSSRSTTPVTSGSLDEVERWRELVLELAHGREHSSDLGLDL
jgi:hypothetical protein